MLGDMNCPIFQKHIKHSKKLTRMRFNKPRSRFNPGDSCLDCKNIFYSFLFFDFRLPIFSWHSWLLLIAIRDHSIIWLLKIFWKICSHTVSYFFPQHLIQTSYVNIQVLYFPSLHLSICPVACFVAGFQHDRVLQVRVLLKFHFCGSSFVVAIQLILLQLTNLMLILCHVSLNNEICACHCSSFVPIFEDHQYMQESCMR